MKIIPTVGIGIGGLIVGILISQAWKEPSPTQEDPVGLVSTGGDTTQGISASDAPIAGTGNPEDHQALAEATTASSIPSERTQGKHIQQGRRSSTPVSPGYASPQDFSPSAANRSTMGASGSLAGGNASFAAGQTGGSGDAGVSPGAGRSDPEIVMDVPVGAVAPAAFLDNEPRSPQQQEALNRIAEEFQAQVENPPDGLSAEENWRLAKELADRQYKKLFGFQAYNYLHLQAAKEAVAERNSTSNSP